MTRVAVLGAALLGVVNLIPGTSPGSDGRNLLRWLSAPTATRAALRAAYYQEEVSRTLRTIARGEVDGDRSGGPVGDGNDPRRALAAFQRRWSTGHAQSAGDLIADAERLAALARADGRSLLLDIRPGVDPPDLCSVALLLRAIAECYLGNHADADTLVGAAGGDYPQLAQVVAAIRATAPVPPLSAPAPMVGT